MVSLCLTSTFFSFQCEFYAQTCGVVMGSPLSPIVANLFMEDFESKALASAKFCPRKWNRFMDDTCVIWPHGCEKLDLFLDHLNSQSDYIKFTMEVEVDGCLPFLDILLSRRDDGSISHRVFHKKTHTEQYFHVDSHHFPAQKFGVLCTLASLALRIFDDSHLESEKSHLLDMFETNGYRIYEGFKAFQKASKGSRYKSSQMDPISKVYLLFI